MSLSDRAVALQKKSTVALAIAPGSIKALIVELLQLVKELADAIDNGGK